MLDLLNTIDDWGIAFWMGEIDGLEIALDIREKIKKNFKTSVKVENIEELLSIVELENIISKSCLGIAEIKDRIKNVQKLLKNFKNEKINTN